MNYEVLRAGISDDRIVSRVELMKALDGELYQKVVFYLCPLSDLLPVNMPEVEVFMWSESLQQKYVQLLTPVRTASGEYMVEFRYELNGTSSHNRGVSYAELRCEGRKLAGIVFAVEGARIPGFWVGKDLEPLNEYTTEAAEDKFEQCFGFRCKEIYEYPDWFSGWDEYDFMRDRYPYIRRKD